MRLGVMQPYFFPYLGYFDLINRTDTWVVFDTVQYISRGWMNRNRILHQNRADWQYINMPVKKHAQTAPITSIEIADDPKWKDRILGQLIHYRKHAPYYQEVTALLEGCFSTSTTSLSQLNVETLERVCAYLDIPFNYQYSSELALDLDSVEGAEAKVLAIAETLGATEYINPSGGRDLYNPDNFSRAGIQLHFQAFESFAYSCGGYTFIPNLSIVDVMMWNPPDAIKAHLNH